MTEQPVLTETPVDPVKEAASRVNLRDILASIGKDGGIKFLKERRFALTVDGENPAIVELTVRELTKHIYDKLLDLTTANMPQVPTLAQNYTTARRDPLTGAVKPAGTYEEPNPSDPHYIAATQKWFSNSAVMFGIFASAPEWGLNLSLSGEEFESHLHELVNYVYERFPVPVLLDIAYEAAQVNRGIPIAEQLISLVESQYSGE